MSEIWKPVIGDQISYEVSNFGRVRSKDRIKIYTRRDQYSGRDLRIKRLHKGRILRPGPSNTGHLTVVLGRSSAGGRGSVGVHILVLEAFIGARPDGMECRHLDDDPTNNRLENLAWGTRSENIHDAMRNGKKLIGEKAWNAKLKDSDISSIRARFEVDSYADIARDYGVNEATIRQIKYGKAWRHL